MYSWQKSQWESIMQRKQALPHALLFHGRAGIGKSEFAIDLARALICVQAKGLEMACGRCPSCIWMKEGAHPDFRFISPEDVDENSTASKKKKTKKSQISVAQIRQ